MANLELELGDKLPESFKCELYIRKEGRNIYCTCINPDSRFGSAIDGYVFNEERIWEPLLQVLADNISHTLKED